MALAPPSSRFAVPDGWLLKRLARGDPGILERIRERYGLTIYAIAYGVLMDPGRSADVVEETFAECGRTAGTNQRDGETLYDRLATTARKLSGESAVVKPAEAPGTRVPQITKVVRERWIAPPTAAAAWSLIL